MVRNAGTSARRRLLAVIMDGVGISKSDHGNAVRAAATPVMHYLEQHGLYTTLSAHGRAVGMPSDKDIGNSEVGHNALGAGKIFDQGATLVNRAVENGSLFKGAVWRELVQFLAQHKGRLHLIGLLSDGNVHSHMDHLFALLRGAKAAGITQVFVHPLLDGRDVAERSAEVYVERLEKFMIGLRAADFGVRVASGGGRMLVTMDRYEADWRVVERGWAAHVRGQAEHHFGSLGEAVAVFRRAGITDQNMPAFVITEVGKPVGTIADGDGVVFFNFRGDRAVEISRAFTEEHLSAFARGPLPMIYYAGMMQYDGDLQLPKKFLVSPPVIEDTLSEFLVREKVRQFACSETQKFGHVTYFWNGNRSGYLDRNWEEYLEIPSDRDITFDQKPQMKAKEITEEAIKRLRGESFDFGRLNFANGDMVGHTGNFDAAVVAVATVDLMLGHLLAACRDTDTILMVTADHGNCDEMLEDGQPKTSHTLNPVPFYVFDPCGTNRWALTHEDPRTLGHVANTILTLMGFAARPGFLPSLVKRA